VGLLRNENGVLIKFLVIYLQVRDITIDYTKCIQEAPLVTSGVIPKKYIQAHFKPNPVLDPYKSEWLREQREVPVANYTATRNYCVLKVNIAEDLKPTISFFYRLDNFYQNHRRYVNSFNAKQLLGDAVDGSTINASTCSPLAHDDDGKIIYPCGLVANSLFNDTYSFPKLLNVPGLATNETYYMMSRKGITWPGMKDLYGPTKYKLDEIVPPPNWYENYKYGYTENNPPPNLKEEEDFQNWMMLAAAPNFYKLFMKNDKDVMKTGTYEIEIEDNFNTTLYNGQKSIVLTTVSTMGSRNIWPGIIFLIVGGICLILDIYFILSFFLWKPRKLGDPSYLSWNQSSGPQGHASAS